MKTLSILLLSMALTACGSISALTPGVTSGAYHKAEAACKANGGVHMVTQTVGVDYDAHCNNGTTHQL